MFPAVLESVEGGHLQPHCTCTRDGEGIQCPHPCLLHEKCSYPRPNSRPSCLYLRDYSPSRPHTVFQRLSGPVWAWRRRPTSGSSSLPRTVLLWHSHWVWESALWPLRRLPCRTRLSHLSAARLPACRSTGLPSSRTARLWHLSSCGSHTLVSRSSAGATGRSCSTQGLARRTGESKAP